MPLTSANPTNLSRTRDAQGRQKGICSISTVRRKNALDQIDDAGAVEDVELACILFEDSGEGKLLDGASSVVRWV